MNNIAMLDYTFLFDPAETGYSNVFQFENDLNAFFSEKGYEAKVIPGIEGGKSRRILHICRKPDIEISEPVEPEKTVKQKLYQLRVNKSPDGKYKNV